MNNQLITISMAEADTFAMEYFMRICGFNREGEKYQRMLAQGLDIKKRIQDRVELKAVVSSFSGDVIADNTATMKGIPFECNAFQRLNPKHIKGIYPYLLTAGNFEMESDEPMLNQLYADIWGTAYVDAGLEVLKKMIEKDQLEHNKNENDICTVLDSFGPGFYGMNVNQIGKFFELLDGDIIGVKARSNSLMLPLKSCAGFFVAVDDRTELPVTDCKSCQSEYKNCQFCHAVVKGKY